jgi:hypothetical protein
VPANTLVFISLPNLSQPLTESYAAMRQRISENPTLQAWWNQNATRGDGRIGLDEMIARLTRLGAYLGPEIVVAGKEFPILLADVQRPSELVTALNDDVTRMTTAAGNRPRIRVVQTPAELAAPANGGTADLIVYAGEKLLVVAPKVSQIQTVLAGSSGFQATALYQQVAQAYAEGVGWLLAADLSQNRGSGNTTTSTVGVGEVQQLIIQQKTGTGGSAYEAVLGFNQTRTGVGTWLAAPGPIGATEFVSPNAYGAAAIVTKDPALILDDIV